MLHSVSRNISRVAVSARGSLLLPKMVALLQLLVQLALGRVLQDEEHPLLHVSSSPP